MAASELAPFSRRQLREALLTLSGISLESESDTESEANQEEPILVEALLVSALQGELQLPPFGRCRRKPYSLRSRTDRLAAASHLCVEVAQSTQFVFRCYHCNNFIVGYLCYHHHTRSCLNSEVAPIALWAALRARNFDAPLPWKWADCDYCIRQEVLASRHHKISQVTTVIHWARFLSGLVPRRIRHAHLRCSTVSWAIKLCLPPEVVSVLLDAL